MKLSFSLSGKPSSKPQSTVTSQAFAHGTSKGSSSSDREFVTEFDSVKTLALPDSRNTVSIPPLPNAWRPHKKMKNLDLPLQSDDPNNLQFELDASSPAEPSDSGMAYGLNLRKPTKSDGDGNARVDGVSGVRSDQLTTTDLMSQKFMEDTSNLRDNDGVEGYNEMPVEDFAKALLSGYGYYEGRGIGRNPKGDIKVFEYSKPFGKGGGGLGFVDVPPSKGNVSDKKEKYKLMEKEFSDGNGVVQNGGSGRYYLGKDVRIIGGREVGSKGRIIEVMKGGNLLLVKLLRNKEEITVDSHDVADLGSVEEEKCLKKLKELKIRGPKEERGGSVRPRNNYDRSVDRSQGKSKDSGNRDGKKDSKRTRQMDDFREESRGSRLVSWLYSHIRVRIISKEFKGGRLYLQKGEVVDVVGPTTCDISMDNNRELIQGVNQELLETALPKRGGPVLVLYGKHKGLYGSLVEKDMDNERAVIRDADTHELLNVHLEQIAEYIGDPSDFGY